MNKKYSHNLIMKVKERNFSNDLTRLIDQSDKYGIDNGPIRIGTQSIIGSMTEFIFEMMDTIDLMTTDRDEEIHELKNEISELKNDLKKLSKDFENMKKEKTSRPKKTSNKSTK